MRDKMECQKCGCISLAYQTTTDKTPHIETWSCGACGHTECFHVAETVKKRTAGFDDFLADLGYDFIDRGSKVDLMELAFVAGGGYALRQVKIKRFDDADETLSLLRRQAE